MSEVQIPRQAVSDGKDLQAPTRALLENLKLLGSQQDEDDANGFAAAFSGPPQSVALIESGATAAAKWWAGGLGASVVAIWTTVINWWGDQADNVKVVVIGGAAFVTAAAILAIGYLIASDVRGRAAAAVATINARSAVARTMIEAAERSYEPAVSGAATQVVPLPTKLKVENTAEPAGNEDGWQAIAMLREADGAIKYVVVKSSTQAIVGAEGLVFL